METSQYNAFMHLDYQHSRCSIGGNVSASRLKNTHNHSSYAGLPRTRKRKAFEGE